MFDLEVSLQLEKATDRADRAVCEAERARLRAVGRVVVLRTTLSHCCSGKAVA